MQWLYAHSPGTGKAEARRFLQLRSGRPGWTTWQNPGPRAKENWICVTEQIRVRSCEDMAGRVENKSGDLGSCSYRCRVSGSEGEQVCFSQTAGRSCLVWTEVETGIWMARGTSALETFKAARVTGTDMLPAAQQQGMLEGLEQN